MILEYRNGKDWSVNEINMSKLVVSLLMSDSPGDVRLTQETLKEWDLITT